MAAHPPTEALMARALELARKGWGQTHPNPMVGALIVEGDQVVAEGWHCAAGQAHAEIAALRALGRRPRPGATLFVTLEPCSTHGHTGACTTAILEAGITHVVVGAVDPNPNHAGRGLELLRAAGVTVEGGVLGDECEDLNLIFNHWVTRQTPFLAAKMALTLDGKFAAASGQSRWVTGPDARADVMRWRRYFPAIAVGAGTALRDDPALTARDNAGVACPVRFIFDRQCRTLAQASRLKLYTDAYADQSIILCSETAAETHAAALASAGLRHWALSERDGHLDWVDFRRRCAASGICGVWLETGPVLATAVLENALADYVFVYQAPSFLADAASPGIGSARRTQGMDAAIRLRKPRRAFLGEDALIRGRPIQP